MNNSSGMRSITLRSFGEQIEEMETRLFFICIRVEISNIEHRSNVSTYQSCPPLTQAFAEGFIGVSTKLFGLGKISTLSLKPTSSKGELVILSREDAVSEPADLEGIERGLEKTSSPCFEQLSRSSKICNLCPCSSTLGHKSHHLRPQARGVRRWAMELGLFAAAACKFESPFLLDLEVLA